MYILKTTSKFRTSLKKYKSDKVFKKKIFDDVLSKLISGEKLDEKYKDHRLTGNLSLYRECHISPDILLVYEIKNTELVLMLINIGSHSNLF